MKPLTVRLPDSPAYEIAREAPMHRVAKCVVVRERLNQLSAVACSGGMAELSSETYREERCPAKSNSLFPIAICSRTFTFGLGSWVRRGPGDDQA